MDLLMEKLMVFVKENVLEMVKALSMDKVLHPVSLDVSWEMYSVTVMVI